MECLKKLQFFCFLLLGTVTTLQAQVVQKNDKGERFVVFENGVKQDFTMMSADSFTISQFPDTLDLSIQRYPIFNDKIAPNENYVSVTEADLAKIAERRAQLSHHAAVIAKKRAEEAEKKRLELEHLISTMSSEEAIAKKMQLQLETAQKLVRETKAESIQANELAYQDELFAKGGSFLDWFLKKQTDKKSKNLDPFKGDVSANTSTNLNLPLGENYGGSIGRENTTLYPPTNRCKVAFEGIDEETNKFRKDIQKQLLFTYTDDRLRVYLKDKPYLKSEGFITSIGGFKFVTLEFTFAYPNAAEAYGIIEKGSVLTIKMLNGRFVNLRSGVMSKGRYDLEKEILTYRVHYAIDRTQWNLLKKSEVDTVLVFWSSGYEEYEVYQMDFFINQIRCMEDR